MERLEKVRHLIDRSMRGLEIGPSFSPIAPKSDGWQVETIDHASRAELVEKYTPHGVDVSKIEDVDWIWQGEPLDDLLGSSRWGTYDFFIASHVIEHIPNMLGFLNSVERLLRDGGILTLVVPDKRHCFDFFKPLTTTADVLDARDRKLRIHTRRTAFAHIAYSSARGGQGAWDERQEGSLSLSHTLEQAISFYSSYDDGPETAYVDFHSSQFVPASFELIIEELRALGLTGFEIAETFPGAGCEFYVALRKGRARAAVGEAWTQVEARRLALLQRMSVEVGIDRPQAQLLAELAIDAR